MAVDELSIGPLYLAPLKVIKSYVKPHFVEITQMHEPWRAGRALLVSYARRRAFAVGIWRKTDWTESDGILDDERWINPKVVIIGPGDLRSWSNGADETESEEDTPDVEKSKEVNEA
jgi:hypothetical protein